MKAIILLYWKWNPKLHKEIMFLHNANRTDVPLKPNDKAINFYIVLLMGGYKYIISNKRMHFDTV